LREPERPKLAPHLSFVKLLLNGLYKLPVISSKTVYRGVKQNLVSLYEKGEKKIWWALSSTTSHVEILQSEKFLGKTGERTKFNIDLLCGFDITLFSSLPTEREILLIPGICLEVVMDCPPPFPISSLPSLPQPASPAPSSVPQLQPATSSFKPSPPPLAPKT